MNCFDLFCFKSVGQLSPESTSPYKPPSSHCSRAKRGKGCKRREDAGIGKKRARRDLAGLSAGEEAYLVVEIRRYIEFTAPRPWDSRETEIQEKMQVWRRKNS